MLLQRRASFEQAQKTVGKEGAKRLLFSKKKRKKQRYTNVAIESKRYQFIVSQLFYLMGG